MRRGPAAALGPMAATLLFAVARVAFGQPPPQPAPAQPAPAYDPSLQAGGLAPPPPMGTAPGQPPPPASGTSTEQRLDRAKEEDAGRGLNWIWICLLYTSPSPRDS